MASVLQSPIPFLLFIFPVYFSSHDSLTPDFLCVTRMFPSFLSASFMSGLTSPRHYSRPRPPSIAVKYCEAMKFDSPFLHYKIYIYRLQELLVLLILVPLLAVSVITGHLLRGPTTGPLPCGGGTLSQSVPVAWRHAPSHLSPILPLQSGVPANQFDRRDNTLRHAAAEQPLQTYPINKNKTMVGKEGGGKNNDSSGLMGRSSCQRLEIRLEAEAHKPQRCSEAAGASG